MLRLVLAMLLVCVLSSGAFAAAAAEAAEKPSPIPSVPQAIAPAVTTLVVFALLLAVLGKFAWAPIASGLKAREEKIRREIADAERIATSMKMQAQQEAEEAKERAMRDIEAARKAAVADIYAQAADLSTSIAEKILRRNLNANDQRDLVEASLQQFQSVGGKD